MMSSFDYAQTSFNPREQIRVLTLFPATPPSSKRSGEQQISTHTSLEAVNWTDKPPYIALSYMWGDQTHPETILVNEQTFAIGANLHEALRQLQAEEPICLWVDAICINQNDDLEKGEQVANMSEIYKAAASVFAWLGPSANDSDAAMDAIKRLGEDAINAGQLDLSREVMYKFWDPDPERLLDSVRQPFQDLSERIGLDYEQVAVKSLSERGYWHRTWIT